MIEDRTGHDRTTDREWLADHERQAMRAWTHLFRTPRGARLPCGEHNAAAKPLSAPPDDGLGNPPGNGNC